MVEARYDNFWRRLGAIFVDALVIAPFGLFVHKLIQLPAFNQHGVAVALALQSACVYAYQVILTRQYGQTVGKMATGVVAVMLDEQRLPTWRASFLREGFITITNVVGVVYDITRVYHGTYFEDPNGHTPATYALAVFMLAMLLIEIVPFMLTDKQRAAHDYVGGTVVVKKSMSIFADKTEQL